MRKPEIEIVKFDSSDVIATSGINASLTISKYKDGTPNNLTVNFNEIEYKSYDSLHNALKSAGLVEKTDTSPGAGASNFYNYFDYDSNVDGGEHHNVLNYGVNGTYTYTWFGTEYKWKHN